ncbi:MAG: hypothetical protein KGH52_04550, partial [Candidatus Micrarchaeota archaeon]|nr:hypothetical protein [Candidatus Micrarchaeota archaeon]
KWRIDREKLCEFESGINNLVITGGMQINCNDFFMCEGCYETNKVILPFDTAFEMDFKCTACGKPLDMLSKEQTTALFTKAGNVEIS